MSLLFAAWLAVQPAVAADEVLDLNSATVEQLDHLPGIGRKKAEAIVQLRHKHPYVRVTQLLEVRGIGSKTLQRLRPYLRVGGAVLPAHVAPSTAATAPSPSTAKAP